MHAKFDFGPETDAGQRIVYVRPIPVADLPDDIQRQAGGAKMLYALHDADGERLALVADRRMAFVIARQNDLAPVNVH